MSTMNYGVDNKDAGGNQGTPNTEGPFVPTDQHPNARMSSDSGSSCCPSTYPSQQGVGFGSFAYEMLKEYPGRVFGIQAPPGFQPNYIDLTPFPAHSGRPMSLPCNLHYWGCPAAVKPMDSLNTFYGSQGAYPNPISNWDTFEETCSQPMFPVGLNTEHQGVSSFHLQAALCDNRNVTSNTGNNGGEHAPAVGFDEERYQLQIQANRALPLGVHKRIRSMPGCIIIDYFEVFLVRFRNENIVESNQCFAVFTKKPETGRHWLTAFAVNKHFRTVVKYNRLLTSHLKVKVNGPTAIELQTSKLAPAPAGDTYLFNFEHAHSAKLFLDLFHGARTQIWSSKLVAPNQIIRNTHHPSRLHASDFNSGIHPGIAQGPLVPQNCPVFKPRRNNILDSPRFLASLEGTVWHPTGHGRMENTALQNVEGVPVVFEQKDVKFKTNGKLFVRSSENEPLVCIGEGDICVAQGKNYYDKMVFVSKSNKEVICHHYIYQWNKITESKKNDEQFACTWMASGILGNMDNKVPSLLQIKLHVESEEDMTNFCEVLSESNIKGKELARCAIH